MLNILQTSYKVAICLPSKNEADSIAHTVEQVDQGLAGMLNPAECLLVNVDSSTDNTTQVFLDTPTLCHKLSLHNTKSGKGTQLLNFLQWCKKREIPYAATIDTDIRTITSEWAPKLILPLLNDTADFVSPLYERSRFEGNTTNHFAMPILYAWFGKLVRQPIGGEFAFNRKAYEYFLEQPVYQETTQYGIDIFLTAHALGSGFLRTTEAELGQKLHKPSFPKIMPMFGQVFTSGILALQQYEITHERDADRRKSMKSGIIDGGNFAHKAQLDDLCNQMLADIESNVEWYERILEKTSVSAMLHSYGHTTSELWAVALTNTVKQFIASDRSVEEARNVAKRITPLFMLRTIAYMLDNETKTPSEVEKSLRAQANLVKNKLK